MAWRRPGDMPLSEPMIVSLTTHTCVTRPQRVNEFAHLRRWSETRQRTRRHWLIWVGVPDRHLDQAIFKCPMGGNGRFRRYCYFAEIVIFVVVGSGGDGGGYFRCCITCKKCTRHMTTLESMDKLCICKIDPYWHDIVIIRVYHHSMHVVANVIIHMFDSNLVCRTYVRIRYGVKLLQLDWKRILFIHELLPIYHALSYPPYYISRCFCVCNE